MSSGTEIMTSPKAEGCGGPGPSGQPARSAWHRWIVLAPRDCSVGNPRAARVASSTSSSPWPRESCSDLLSASGGLWRVARDAPAWGHGAGRGAHLDGAGRPCSRLPPALRRPGLATWEPAPRGLATTLSWERRPRRHHEEVLLRWAPRPAWGGSASGTCASHLNAGGLSGRGHRGTKWVW